MAKIETNAVAKTRVPISPGEATSDGGAGHYEAYEEHARTLRTWLVAYGIGGPVLILSQAEVWKRLAASGSLRLIAGLFLSGVVLQVILAAVNKSAMWACYYGELEPAYQSTRRYKIGLWLSERYLIDFFLILLGCFHLLMQPTSASQPSSSGEHRRSDVEHYRKLFSRRPSTFYGFARLSPA